VWNHSTCVDITNEEFKLFMELKGKALWKCNQCRQTPASVVDKLDTCSDINGYDDTRQCFFEHIKILTGQIFTLTNNHKDLSEQITFIKQENALLKSALDNQADAISGLLTGEGNQRLYSSKVKSSSHNINNRINCVDKSMNVLEPLLINQQVAANKNGRDLTMAVSCQSVSHANIANLADDSKRSEAEEIDLCSINNDVTSKKSEEFVFQRNRRNKSNENKLNTHRPAPIIGTNSSNNIKSVGKTKWLFISRLAPEVEKEELVGFLKSNLGSEIKCEEWKTKYEGYKSFKVGLSESQIKNALNPDLWPNGVLVKIFRPNRLKNKDFLGNAGRSAESK